MRTSTNYHFNLPELSDVADITKLTANWESLDSTLRIFAVGLADVEDTVHQMNTSDLPAIRQSVTDVSEYAESVGESVTALDTEIHTTRPYVDTNTEQTITGLKNHKNKINYGYQNIGATEEVTGNTDIGLISVLDKNRAYEMSALRTRMTPDATHLYVTAYSRKAQSPQYAELDICKYNDGRTEIHSPGVPANASSNTVVNKDFVQATDGRNNLVHNIGNESIDGTKTWDKIQKMLNVGYWWRQYTGSAPAKWYEMFRLKRNNTDRYTIDISGAVNGSPSICYGKIYLVVYANNVCRGAWIYRFSQDANAYIVGDVCALVDNEDDTVSLYFKIPMYGGLDFTVVSGKEQSNVLPPSAVQMRSAFTPNDVDELPSGAYILQNMTQR